MSLPYLVIAAGLIITPDGCARLFRNAEKGVFKVIFAV